MIDQLYVYRHIYRESKIDSILSSSSPIINPKHVLHIVHQPSFDDLRARALDMICLYTNLQSFSHTDDNPMINI